jgi:hypothetical protein
MEPLLENDDFFIVILNFIRIYSLYQGEGIHTENSDYYTLFTLPLLSLPTAPSPPHIKQFKEF